MSSKAFVVGVASYADPKNNLQGVNADIPAIVATLGKFGIADVEVLRDANATAQGVMNGLNKLVTGAKKGDVRVFYFSGHGVLLPPDFSGGDDADGRDEALVPYEGTVTTLILDNWIAGFLKTKIPADVAFWGIYDSCHSGDIFKAATVAGVVPDEVAKQVAFDDLILDGPPSLRLPRANAISTKALVLDGTIPTSFHLAAAEPQKSALCKTIDGLNRSVFTWALSSVAQPGMSVADFEAAVTQKSGQQTTQHTPQIACAPSNKNRKLFT